MVLMTREGDFVTMHEPKRHPLEYSIDGLKFQELFLLCIVENDFLRQMLQFLFLRVMIRGYFPRHLNYPYRRRHRRGEWNYVVEFRRLNCAVEITLVTSRLSEFEGSAM